MRWFRPRAYGKMLGSCGARAMLSKTVIRKNLPLAIAFACGLAALPLAILAFGLMGWLSFDGQAEPPAWEYRPAEAAKLASLSRAARGLANPIDAQSETDLLAGLKLFRNNCAGCHGDFHAPSMWGTKNFYPRVPQFGVDAPVLTAPQMFVAIKHGIRYSGMGAWEGMLEDRQIWQVATFLEQRDKLPPAVDARWKRKS